MSARIEAKRTPQFDAWLKSLRDGMTRIRLVRRLERAQRGALASTPMTTDDEGQDDQDR